MPISGVPLTPIRHIEYFHDHVRIEHLLFEGVLTPVHGLLRPDLSRPGLGLAFKRKTPSDMRCSEGPILG